MCLCLISVFRICPFWEWGVEVSHYYCVRCNVCFELTKVSLMNVATLAFGAYIFRIGSFSWTILPLMSMKCPSLSFLIILGWKSILIEIRMASRFYSILEWLFQLVSSDHLLGELFSSLSFWGNSCLFPLDGFPVSSKMLGPICLASLIVYVFLLGNWVHCY